MKTSLNYAQAAIALLLLSCSGSQTMKPIPTDAPDRIISLVPAVTEILFAIGANRHVVGVSNYDSYPPEVIRLPKVGGLVNPNLEKILELEPELVVTYRTQFNLKRNLEEVGIQTYPFSHGSIHQMLDYILGLARILKLNSEGQKLVEGILNDLNSIQGHPLENRPRVLLVHSRELGTLGSFYSGGAESFFSELIEIAGGINIFDDVQDDSIQPSLEEILIREPSIIIELLPTNKDDPHHIALRMQDWATLKTLPAVQQKNVHILAGDHLLLIGPRVHLSAHQFAEIIKNGRNKANLK